MPMIAPKRALLAISALVCISAAGAGLYLYRLHRPLAGANAGSAPDLLSQLPAGAPAIAYIDVAALRRLQDSTLGAVLGLAKPGPRGDREYEDFVRDTGFDYTRDLDHVALAFWPANQPASSGGFAENRVLAIASGRFDEKKIEAYALRSGKLVTHGTQSLYEMPGNPPVSVAFLSPMRIVLASGKGVENLLPLPSSPARDPAMQERITRVAGAPIFAVARTDNLPISFYANFRNSPQLERLARSVRGLTLAGQPDGNGIKVALDAECDSMKNAIEIATLLDGFRMVGSLALADPKTRRQLTEEQAVFLSALLNRTEVTHQDHWVRLSLAITPAMLAPSNSAR
jgi:hypothetical protein